MNYRSTIALAALATAMLAPEAAMAKARHKPVRHHRAHHAARQQTEAGLTSSEQLQIAQQQISQLQAQVNALQARLDQGTGAGSAQAAADAAAANAKADKALALAQTADANAKKKPVLPDAAKWVADTKISGRVYFNASHVTHEVKGIKTGNTDNGGFFNIKRAYIGVDHKFDDTFSGNVTMDADNVAGTTGNLVGKGFYIKKAYLQAKVNPALVVRLGAADMPWIPYVEGIYGLRHIDQTLSDRTKFGTSADWGVHVLGDLADGMISYQVSAVDGAGYRDVHFSRTVDLEGRLSAKVKGFNLAVGGYTGKLGKDIVVASGAANSLQTYQRFNALAAYSDKVGGHPVTVGVEYFWAKNKAFNSTAPISTTAVSDTANGYSAFASISPMDKWSLFGRYDWVKPSNTLTPAFKEDYYNVGLQWSPSKIVDLALVYKRDAAQNGAFATGNLQSGVIGCATGGSLTCLGKGTYDEFGLFGQFRF